MGERPALTVDAGGLHIEVTGVTRAVWSRLRDQHPAGPGAEFGPGFLPALAAACTGYSVEQAEDLLDDVDAGEELEQACLALSRPGIRAALLHRLDTDPRLHAELAYCTEAGVSRSAFLAWPDDDQDLAVAWWVRRHDTCPGCGVPSPDMTSPGATWEVRQRGCIWCDIRHQADQETSPEHRHAVHVDLVRSQPGPGDDR